eukprot:8844845-Pyramimonas_sp.AAC.1
MYGPRWISTCASAPAVRDGGRFRGVDDAMPSTGAKPATDDINLLRRTDYMHRMDNTDKGAPQHAKFVNVVASHTI